MASGIPTSTAVTESAIIEAPFSDVWHLIKIENFANFWSALSKSEWVKGVSPDTDIVKWTFKDGTVLEVKQEEHSVGVQGLGFLLAAQKWLTISLFGIRPSTTTLPTRSSLLNLSSATPLLLAPSAASKSLLASMKDTHSFNGRATSLAMLMPVRIQFFNSSGRGNVSSYKD